MQTLTIETVTVTRTVSGTVTKAHVAVSGIPAPYRIGKRCAAADRAGTEFIQSLAIGSHPDTIDGEPAPPRTGVVFVGVFDGQRRQLAAWRTFDLGMTGTGDRHPMLRGRSPLYRRGGAA